MKTAVKDISKSLLYEVAIVALLIWNNTKPSAAMCEEASWPDDSYSQVTSSYSSYPHHYTFADEMLDAACRSGWPWLQKLKIKTALKLGAHVDLRDTLGQTPLHYASNQEVADLLLQRGARIDARDSHRQTPLHTSLDRFRARPEVAALLIQRGAEVDAHDEHQKTPLHLASCASLEIPAGILTLSSFKGISTPILIKLIQKGASVNARDEHQRTPLHYAEGHERVLLLLQNGAQVDARDVNQKTPLHLAEYPDKIKILIQHSADTTVRDVHQRTPLHCDEVGYKTPLLLQAGAQVNARDIYQQTPLHCRASEEFSSRQVTELIKGGATVNIYDHQGESPFFLALKRFRFTSLKTQTAVTLFNCHALFPFSMLQELDEMGKLVGSEIRWESDGTGARFLFELRDKNIKTLLSHSPYSSLLDDIQNLIVEYLSIMSLIKPFNTTWSNFCKVVKKEHMARQKLDLDVGDKDYF